MNNFIRQLRPTPFYSPLCDPCWVALELLINVCSCLGLNAVHREVYGLINASVTVCEDVGGMPIKVVGDVRLR